MKTPFDAIEYNPFAPGFREDPYPQLHRLRSLDPIHWSSSWSSWVLTGYNDIRFVLSDSRFQIGLELLERSNPFLRHEMQQPWNRIIRDQILSGDPPAHPRIRGIMAKGFTPARLEQLRPVIQRCTDQCIDRGLEAGNIDLISGFAHRLPFLVICEMLGVPEADRPELDTYTPGLVRSTDVTPMGPDELYQCNQSTMGFRDYFLKHAAKREGRAPENVFDEMLAAHKQEKLSWDEFIANVLLLFIAGHDTVINLFGNGLLALYRNPDQLAQLIADPALIRPAIEELLRYETSVTVGRRTAIEEVPLRDKIIRKGQYLLLILNAGNRDPEVYDDPDRLDVRRKNVKPLSFGGGIHHCLGAQLARLEGQVGFSTLFARVPDLELDTLEPTWTQNTVIRGLESLTARCRRGASKFTPAPVVDAQTHHAAVQWLKYDARTMFFTYALQYLNWERIEGDILEFGVAIGKSLALLARLHQESLHTWRYSDDACHERRFVGFDSFEGLPDDSNEHPRWGAGSFASNYAYGHPSLAYDERVSPEALHRLFEICRLPRPQFEVGWFDQTIAASIPRKYKKAALVHIDSDLYTSARCALEGVAPILTDGALLCFDDWFMYRGDPNQGEARALADFLQEHPEWMAIPYQTYSVFCNSFIMRRRSAKSLSSRPIDYGHEQI
ncbi:MAG TPA: cytochrome P450 [Polyangiales bacterium]|nr:cytochrome P450 [Polyangiales bacterium]